MNKCKICGNESGNEEIILQERQLGLGDRFEYIECSNCKCIQIKEIPPDMNRYYPPEYYAFDEPKFPSELNWLNSFLKKSLINYYMGYFDPAGFLLSFIYDHPFPWIRKREISFHSKILDVGAGSGRKLLSLQRSGFSNLTGIDPYISGDLEYDKGLKILKKDISELDERYDFITLHHSFEHMPDPENVLKKLERLLKPEGTLVIRIPVGDSYAWHKYGEYWFQLDAPRHLFLHTQKSIEVLLQKTSLHLDDIHFDSGPQQFIMSEKYIRGLTLFAPDNQYSRKEIKSFARQADILNKEKKGDSACFYIKKKN